MQAEGRERAWHGRAAEDEGGGASEGGEPRRVGQRWGGRKRWAARKVCMGALRRRRGGVGSRAQGVGRKGDAPCGRGGKRSRVKSGILWTAVAVYD